MSEATAYLQLYVEGRGAPTYAFGEGAVRLDPAIDTRGYNKIEITVSQVGGIGGPWFLADDVSYRDAQNVRSNGITLTQGTNVFDIPASDQGKQLYLYFAGYAQAGETTVSKITKIRFI